MTNVKKKSKVVMLPTNEKATRKSDLAINENNLLFQPSKLEGTWFFLNKFQHLYILSDDEIKEDDWYLSNEALRNTDEPIWVVRKCDKITNGWLESNSNPGQGDNPEWSKKIIATTDSSLMYHDKTSIGENKKGLWKILPQPSKQFIEKYIESYNSGNVITDVMVEYSNEIVGYTTNFFGDIDVYDDILKINPKDNTITISKCKDSWSREEVIELMQKSIIYGTELEAGAVEVDWKIDYKLKWIEENL